MLVGRKFCGIFLFKMGAGMEKSTLAAILHVLKNFFPQNLLLTNTK
jgi:hypothetical protein